MEWVSLISGWLICIAVSSWLGSTKNRPFEGFAAGFLLGILGVIIMALAPKKAAKTPAIDQATLDAWAAQKAKASDPFEQWDKENRQP